MAASTAVAAKPLYANQDMLPSLPVPSLRETMEKYLRSVRAFASDDEYAHAAAVAIEFESGIGATLQSLLEERAAEQRNWLEAWWEEFIYLRPRWPLLPWSNYLGAAISDDIAPLSMSQAGAGAMVITQLLAFRDLIVTEGLEGETLAGRPLCMHQYSRMFNSCRVPGSEVDVIETYPTSGARHIIVLRNNAVFKFNVLDEEGRALPMSDYMHGLSEVMRLACVPFDTHVLPPVSVLTSEERHVWSRARTHMIDADAVNRETLECIQRALFVLVLERTDARTLTERSISALLGNGCNRWYDKPFNVIVWPSGMTGVNGEHTWADALVVVKQQDFVMRKSAAHLLAHGVPTASEPPSPAYTAPVQCQWKLDATTLAAIERAAAHAGALINSVQLRTLEFKYFGRNMMKRSGFTPDFFLQMCIQLAHWRLHSEFVPTYETAHTRLFYHGRTETTRSLSVESVAFCRAMTTTGVSEGERYEKFKAAIEAHGAMVKDAMMGKGIDRHLLGLQIAAEITGAKPSLFTDPSFVKSRRFGLSTSNVSISSTSTFGGYAPFFAGGYGVCYSLQDNMLNVCVTGIRDTRTNVDGLVDALRTALVDCMELCMSRSTIYVAAAKL